MTNKVSIIMPMYNAERFICKTIDSVLRQTFENWELIIVDDNSTDDSVNIVNSFEDNRIKLFVQKFNQGAASARNKAIEISTGDYLAFLDSDDIWKQNKLQKQIAFMEENKLNFTCTYYGKINEDDEDLNYTIKSPKILNYDGILLNCPGNSTVVYNVKMLGKNYIPSIKKRNDYLMWLQVIRKANQLVCLEDTLSYHRVRENSLSSNKFKLVKYHWIIYRKYENLSLWRSLRILGRIVVRTIFRKV